QVKDVRKQYHDADQHYEDDDRMRYSIADPLDDVEKPLDSGFSLNGLLAGIEGKGGWRDVRRSLCHRSLLRAAVGVDGAGGRRAGRNRRPAPGLRIPRKTARSHGRARAASCPLVQWRRAPQRALALADRRGSPTRE